MPAKELLGRFARLIPETGIRGKRTGGFQILDDGTEIHRFRIKGFVFCDLCTIQNLETVALEHLFAAPAFKCNDLTVNTFFAGAIQVTEIRAHERPGCRDFGSVWQQIDMKMRRTPRSSGHFAPAMYERPANEASGAFVVAEVAR